MAKSRKWAVKWGSGKQNTSHHRTKKLAVAKGSKKKKEGKHVVLFYPPGHSKYQETL